jgi:acyl dehydratase
MTTATHEFNAELIGKWGEPIEFAIERDRIKAYADATNDSIPAHAAGDIAPPVFAIVPAFQALSTASVGVIPSDFLLGILHGEQDFRYRSPIKPDTTVVTRAKPIGFTGRSSGVTVSLLAETRDKATDELLVEQYMVPFVRGAQYDGSVGEDAPGHRLEDAIRETDPVAEVSQTFDADQTFRYSEASGDPVPVHLDDEIARSVGLPGIIIHGLCTMAFTSRALIEHACPDDPTRLRRLAVRFSRPVQPEQTITTRFWQTGANGASAAYAYETTSDSGDVVITDGLGEIA